MFGIKHDMMRKNNNVRHCKTTSLGMPPHPLSYFKVISGSQFILLHLLSNPPNEVLRPINGELIGGTLAWIAGLGEHTVS
jgi:hypothetical protein